MRQAPRYRAPTCVAKSCVVPRKATYSTRNNAVANKSEQPNLVAINPRKISIGKTVHRSSNPQFVKIGNFVVNVKRIDYVKWTEDISNIRFGSLHGIDASKKYYPAEHEAIRQLQNELVEKTDNNKS